MALSRATGPAEAKEAVIMARSANVKGAMRNRGGVKKLSTTRPFEGYLKFGAPGSKENRKVGGKVEFGRSDMCPVL